MPYQYESKEDLDEEHPAVDHPVTQMGPRGSYEDAYTFVRELSSNRYDYKHIWDELRDPENRVIRGSELPLKSRPEDVVEGAQHWGKFYMNPGMDLAQSLSMHVVALSPRAESKKHAHQNEALMYILEGEGYEIHDGERTEWEAGDLVVIHGGSVHKHYSLDPDNQCKALIIKPKSLYQLLHLIYQGTVESPPRKPSDEVDWTPPEPYRGSNGETVYPSQLEGMEIDEQGADQEEATSHE